MAGVHLQRECHGALCCRAAGSGRPGQGDEAPHGLLRWWPQGPRPPASPRERKIFQCSPGGSAPQVPPGRELGKSQAPWPSDYAHVFLTDHRISCKKGGVPPARCFRGRSCVWRTVWRTVEDRRLLADWSVTSPVTQHPGTLLRTESPPTTRRPGTPTQRGGRPREGKDPAGPICLPVCPDSSRDADKEFPKPRERAPCMFLLPLL